MDHGGDAGFAQPRHDGGALNAGGLEIDQRDIEVPGGVAIRRARHGVDQRRQRRQGFVVKRDKTGAPRHPAVQLGELAQPQRAMQVAGAVVEAGRGHLIVPGVGGAGRVEREKTLSVNIPAGVEDGTRIRVAGEGEAGLRGGPAGDLYIFVSIKPHRFFRRDGADIQCRVPIPLTTAALGGTLEVPTIDGNRARVNIPAGTQTGQQFRLRSKGMSVLRSNARGDMYVQAQVETPVNLTKQQRELLRQFDEAGGGHSHSPEAEGFFTKVKELWEDFRE